MGDVGSGILLGLVGLDCLRSSFPLDSCGTKAVRFVDAPFLRFFALAFCVCALSLIEAVLILRPL